MESDHADVSPQTVETPGRAEWPRLLARIVEGIVRAELHQFEENLMAFFSSAIADAYASFIWISAQVIGAAFLLTALIMLLGIWLLWWAAFALVGVMVIAVGSRVRARACQTWSELISPHRPIPISSNECLSTARGMVCATSPKYVTDSGSIPTSLRLIMQS